MLKESVIEAIKQIVGSENVQLEETDLYAYGYDASPEFYHLPEMVVAPGSKEEIIQILAICRTNHIAIVARGSGSNLSGGTVPVEGGLVMLFTRMNKILEFDKQNLTLTVEPGVITKAINQHIAASGLFFPPDPGSMQISTIGGNISENSGGLRALKYGVIKDYILGLEVVLSNGDVLQTGGKLTKDVAGLDLTQLMVGSEGTLGIITKAILKLMPVPETNKTMIATYRSMEAAAQSVSDIIAAKITPATMEFLDQVTIKAVEDFAHVGLPTDAAAMLLIQQDGHPREIDEDIKTMAKVCRDGDAIDVQVAKDEAEGAKLMAARRTALSALARVKPTTILEDATVPRSEIAALVKFVNETAKKYNLYIGTFGHAGDGNMHPTCLTDLRDEDEIKRVHLAFDEIYQKTIELGGTVTGEHGVGLAKLPYLPWKLGRAGMRADQAIKKALDPDNILNPQKLYGEEVMNHD
ncbi:FAD-linked oxidase C-terminal domain-containing protein [Agrilactobacillus yilanensis]|uniref:FAD-linked oxidase C-terminal domain-containing protein n=1 Tax=Agrilactobacillus yilanensis TaxID=2485997 RepID=A0ABW4J8L6_9LACO|nr:FAD-linked oxidase C-terminal domain-containing protein [Agrilactobacillus yilanensis]